MPEGVNPSLQLPGYSAPHDIPGQAKKLSAITAAGRGELNAEQAEANKLFRTRDGDEYTAPMARKVTTIEGVTAGLGLDRSTEHRVQRMVEEQRADFTKKGQTQRSFLAANAITESLRRIKDVPSDARMEITKRARSYWRNTQATDYGREPIVRAPQGTQMRSDTKLMGKSGVRFIIRDPLMKKMPPLPGQKPLPTGMNATPMMPAAPAQPTGAPQTPPPQQGGANVQKPPPGYQAIPNSKAGGFRLKTGQGWSYWYPGAGITSTPHPADKGQARAKGAAEAKGKTPKGAPPQGAKGPGGPPKPPGGKGPPAPPGKGPPPLPGAAQKPPAAPPAAGGAAPAPGGMQPATPPTMAGAPAASNNAAPSTQQPEQQGPGKASDKPQVMRDASGEKRQFHPQVTAHTPAGKENDHQHHAGEFQRHRAEKAQAMRQGDQEKAKAHTYAMNYHADKHNRLIAASQGRQYNPKGQYPGADTGEDGGEPQDPMSAAVQPQYDRAGTPGKNGEQASAADPRQRFIPESAAVKGMRERIGKAVNIMADLSQAHDHLSSLRAKRLEAKRSGHPLARRMISQIDAEMAATKHDIVQLEDAHSHAMNEVMQHQSMLRNEKIRSNPIFQAFMSAMQGLSGLSNKLGTKVSAATGAGLEAAKGAIEDFKTKGARAEQAKQGEQFDQGLQAAGAKDANPESGEVKPLGVSKEDIAARFGDPEQQAAEQARAASADETLAKLGEAQGEGAEEVNPEDVEELPPEEGEEPLPGAEEEAPEPGPAEAPEAGASGDRSSEADSAIRDIMGLQQQREGQAQQQQQKQQESQAFDNDIATMRAKRDKAVQDASAQGEKWLARNKGRNPQRVMREALGEDEATADTMMSGMRPIAKPGSAVPVTSENEEKGTLATGARKKRQNAIVAKSAALVKSMEWREVLRLAPKLENTLRKAAISGYVVPLAHHARAPMTFLDLYMS